MDDKTLDLETEAVTLPFAASKIKDSRTGPYTEIPLYSYNGDGELEYDDSLTPRLLLCTDGTKGTFQGLDWESIFRFIWDNMASIMLLFLLRQRIQVYVSVNYFNFKLLWQTNKKKSLI